MQSLQTVFTLMKEEKIDEENEVESVCLIFIGPYI